MCCNLFHVLGIHLCEYVLTTLPRNIGKVLNVFICCTWYLQEYRGICGFLLEKKCRLNISMKSHSITIPKVGSPAYTI